MNFFMCTAWDKVGRGASRGLTEASQEGRWSPVLDSTIRLLLALLDLNPTRWIRLGLPPRRPVVVYTDASWTESLCRLGAVVFVDGLPTRAAWCDLPSAWLSALHPRGTQISPAETLGPAAALATWPRLLTNQDVIFFCDNLGAVFSLISGVASVSDLQAIIAASHAALASATVRWWLEWVPSDSNCSDGLSRDGQNDNWCITHGLTPEHLYLPAWLKNISDDVSALLGIISYQQP